MGKEAAYAEVLARLDDGAQDVTCTCDQFRLVHAVLVSTLQRFKNENGTDAWTRMHKN